MADSRNQGLFRRLTQLFRSGPVIKRKVLASTEGSKTSSAFEIFGKNQSHVYSTAMSAYGTYDRMARYSDFSEMEYTPEISSALDIYAEETVASDEYGQVLHVYSENPTIQKLLEELFYDTLNVEFNLTGWVRNLCKYGDFFLFNDVSPSHGVINVFPMPVNEVEREEGFDPNDPLAVRFRWITQGNQVLENWQVCHFRVLGNDAFLPYGSSVLEAARRIWRQLILIEDAMLVYRVVRSPERRVFYIDVGNVPPEEIPNYMEQVQSTLKKAQVVDKNTGRVDLRYNPLSVDEDYYLPVRGAETGTKIDTLAGGQNTTAIEDVEYIQKKLFAALKIPKAYLGYDEGLGAKATLSQEDIRFSRTIARIQRTIIAELNKVAIIHLYCNGFDGEDLLGFSLMLSNPSTIAQQQKLELFRSRFEIAGQAPEGMVSREWIRKNIFNMTDSEIKTIEEEKFQDKMVDLEIEAVKLPVIDTPGSEEDSPDDLGEFPPPPPEGGEGETFTDLAGLETSSDIRGVSKDSVNDGFEDRVDLSTLSIVDDTAPIKAQNTLRILSEVLDEDDTDSHDEESELDEKPSKDYRKGVTPLGKKDGRSEILRPIDHHSYGRAGDSIANPFRNKYDKSDANPLKGSHSVGRLLEDDTEAEIYLERQAKMTSQIRSTLKSLQSQIPNKKSILISEDLNSSEEEG